MASNAKKIINRYGDGTCEENRSSNERDDDNMKYEYTKRIIDRYVSCETNVLEVGCGTGYYGIYLADKCLKYTGLDINPGNIELFNEKIVNLGLSNITGIVGDATNMSELSNESYDVVLSLSSIYHLPPSEKALVFTESKRVCKSGGIIMFAYIKKIGVYMDDCLKEPNEFPNDQKNESILGEGIDDRRDNIYWFNMPDEMEDIAKYHGLSVIENIGVDLIFTPEMYNLTTERNESWNELVGFLCASKSCTIYANHAIMICKKD